MPMTKPIRALDPMRVAVIREVYKAAQVLDFEIFMIGATARIILLEHVFGLSAGRTSNDIDFALAIENWTMYEKIKAYLINECGFTQSNGKIHQLFFNTAEQQHAYEIDLIPFGAIETTPDTIKWPPEMSVILNVAGYRDALNAAIKLELEPDLTISIASLPSIAILKIFAWVDRRHDSKSKDAIDLAALLRSYHEAGNETRIYEDNIAIAALEAADYDIELTGAWLLGKDASKMASQTTKEQILTIINGEKRRYLIQDMAKELKAMENPLHHSERLLQQFINGFSA